MAFDIYGDPLRKGFCEVHPQVNEEYPCSLCYSEEAQKNMKMSGEKPRKQKTLKQRYEDICDEYINAFCQKQQMAFEFWVADQRDVAGFGDWYFSLSDIIYDIDSDCPKGLILQWYEGELQYSKQRINYPSYHKGLRHEQVEPQTHYVELFFTDKEGRKRRAEVDASKVRVKLGVNSRHDIDAITIDDKPAKEWLDIHNELWDIF